MIRTLWCVLLASGSVAACTPVDGERILGKDLARAHAVFTVLPPDFIAGYSPALGTSRTLSPVQLRAIARQHGIVVDEIDPLCFERRGELLTAERLQQALNLAAGPELRVQLIDYSRYAIPVGGELAFSRTDLARPGALGVDGVATWRGHVQSEQQNTAVIWARVRVAKTETWLEAAQPVEAKQVITASQIIARSGWRVPFAQTPLRDPSFVIGNRAARSISPGQVLLPAMIILPNEIERGDEVQVDVASGAVNLRFIARADTSGRRDDLIFVSAKGSGKRWRGRVTGKGTVRIYADQDTRLAAVRERSRVDSNAVEHGAGEAEKGSRDGTGIAAR